MDAVFARFAVGEVVTTIRPTPFLVRHLGLVGLAGPIYDGYQSVQTYGPARIERGATAWLCKRGHTLVPQHLAGPKGWLP